MAALRLWTLLAPLLYLLYPWTVSAQYRQDYMPDTTNPGTYYYRPLTGITPSLVINTYPYTVYLQYNCYYMIDICKNARNFYATTRGQQPHPASGIANFIFGYDLNTGEDKSPKSRQENRRDQSCPDSATTGWRATHTCPESDQSRPWRDDIQWWTTATEAGEQTLQHVRDTNGNIISRSKIRYSCDEFPPATWVEGGDGEFGLTASQTRCAAIPCGGESAKAEQTWQGLIHQNLRYALITYGRMAQGASLSTENSVVLFSFVAPDAGGVADGIAARVYVIRDDGNTDTPVSTAYQYQSRDEKHARTAPHTAEELHALVNAGKGHIYEISANESYVSETDLLGQTMLVPRENRYYDWDEDDAMEEQESRQSSTFNTTLPRTLPEDAKPIPRHVPRHHVTPLLKRASNQTLQAARDTVNRARAEAAKLNEVRVANPLRNKYGLQPGSVVGSSVVPGNSSSTDDVPPLLVITDEIVEAAALVAEADSTAMAGNITKRAAAGTGTFWMQSLDRKGTVPWGDDPDYDVFRNVLDYGAVGDGVTDDTKAIMAAMGTNKTRCGAGCNGSTTKNAIVYFPPGTYLISSSIAMPFGTQVIGDANDRPILMAAPSFVGLGVLSTDEYTGAGGVGIDGNDPEYYVNTSNFYRQIRNVIIDITRVTSGTLVTCVHYQVAQATSMQNVELIATAGSSQIGLYAENGSGGGISDVTFTGGGVGLKGGNQQFTAQRLTFNGCTVGIQVIWDWGWVWKSITMNNVGTGFKLVGDDGVGYIGSVAILDSTFTNVGTAILSNPLDATPGTGSTGIALENVGFSGVNVAVADTTGATLLAPSALVDEWVTGPVYEGAVSQRTFSQGGKIGSYRRHLALLDDEGNYFERAKPQYEDQDVSMFVHTKDLGCKGDGTTDDTAAFQAALYSTLGSILFVDAGSYILTSTIVIPSGAKIVGETWSQLVASGSYFSDVSNPKVLLQVGNKGDIGSVEMQDLLFTTRGPTAGLVLVEWNIQALSPGSAGLWDCHARIGGATGTELTPTECPAVTSGIDSKCSAASLLMHLTPGASGYFENMWLWGADHMIDDPDLMDANNTMVQTSIYVARGFLIESTNPTWLYGTASEHSVFYQYNFHSAANIFAGMLQTESPYFQPNPQPPAPFTDVVGLFPGDPDYTCAAGDEFSGCDESWSVVMTDSQNIFVAGAGIYSWFSTYSQTCIDTQECQKALMLLKNNKANVRFQNLVTIGAKYMAVMDGEGILAKDNLNVDSHPDWSQISILDVGNNGTTDFDEAIWIDPAIWEMDPPQFTCSPPCNIRLPPWTGATRVIDYPILTVSSDTWTTTITAPPLTMTDLIFADKTITRGSGNNKRADLSYWPEPTTTPFWPAVSYTGPNGQVSYTSPTGTFPAPPASIGPDAAEPTSGSYPVRAVEVVFGEKDTPQVSMCEFLFFDIDNTCIQQPWLYGGDDGGDPAPSDEENASEYKTTCPIVTTSSTSTTAAAASTAIVVPVPAPSPYVDGDPETNTVSCYNSGETTENVRMQSAATTFCNLIKDDDFGPGYKFSFDSAFSYNGGVGSVTITNSLQIKDGCTFDYDFDLCKHYLLTLTDGCNCSGVDGKQGGVLNNNCYTWRSDPNRVN